MKKGLRVIAMITLVCFLTTQSVWGAPAAGIEISGGRELPTYLSIDIPAELGTVDALYEAPPSSNPQFILHIQNAHANYEAQMKIKQLLLHMNKKYGFKTIFVEGASEKLDADYLRLFPDQERNLKFCDELAKQGELTGTELFLMEPRSEAVEALGIEQASLYRANYDALKKVFGAAPDVNRFFKGFDSKLDRVASTVLTPETRQLIADWKRFEQGRREFMPFVQSLAKKSNKVLKVDLESLFAQVGWPQITRLLMIQQMEKDLNKEKGLSEKTALIKWLRTKGVTKELLATLESFNEGSIAVGKSATEVSPREVLERLNAEAGPKGFKFSDYPAFSLFAGYVVLRSELDPKVLFEEIEYLFTQMLDTLAQEPQQKALLTLYRDGELLRKLLHLELNRTQWRQVLQNRDQVAIPSLVERLKSAVQANSEPRATSQDPRKEIGSRAASDDARDVIDENRGPWPLARGTAASAADVMPKAFAEKMNQLFTAGLDFYDFARQREGVFYKEMQSAMRSRKITKAILITGGFHTDGMSDLFRENAMSYGIVTPRLSEKSNENLYRTAMLQNREHSFELSYIEKTSPAQSLAGMGKQGVDILAVVAEALSTGTKVARVASPSVILSDVNQGSFAKRNGIEITQRGPHQYKVVRTAVSAEVLSGAALVASYLRTRLKGNKNFMGVDVDGSLVKLVLVSGQSLRFDLSRKASLGQELRMLSEATKAAVTVQELQKVLARSDMREIDRDSVVKRLESVLRIAEASAQNKFLSALGSGEGQILDANTRENMKSLMAIMPALSDAQLLKSLIALEDIASRQRSGSLFSDIIFGTPETSVGRSVVSNAFSPVAAGMQNVAVRSDVRETIPVSPIVYGVQFVNLLAREAISETTKEEWRNLLQSDPVFQRFILENLGRLEAFVRAGRGEVTFANELIQGATRSDVRASEAVIEKIFAREDVKRWGSQQGLLKGLLERVLPFVSERSYASDDGEFKVVVRAANFTGAAADPILLLSLDLEGEGGVYGTEDWYFAKTSTGIGLLRRWDGISQSAHSVFDDAWKQIVAISSESATVLKVDDRAYSALSLVGQGNGAIQGALLFPVRSDTRLEPVTAIDGIDFKKPQTLENLNGVLRTLDSLFEANQKQNPSLPVSLVSPGGSVYRTINYSGDPESIRIALNAASNGKPFIVQFLLPQGKPWIMVSQARSDVRGNAGAMHQKAYDAMLRISAANPNTYDYRNGDEEDLKISRVFYSRMLGLYEAIVRHQERLRSLDDNVVLPAELTQAIEKAIADVPEAIKLAAAGKVFPNDHLAVAGKLWGKFDQSRQYVRPQEEKIDTGSAFVDSMIEPLSFGSHAAPDVDTFVREAGWAGANVHRAGGSLVYVGSELVDLSSTSSSQRDDLVRREADRASQSSAITRAYQTGRSLPGMSRAEVVRRYQTGRSELRGEVKAEPSLMGRFFTNWENSRIAAWDYAAQNALSIVFFSMPSILLAVVLSVIVSVIAGTYTPTPSLVDRFVTAPIVGLLVLLFSSMPSFWPTWALLYASASYVLLPILRIPYKAGAGLSKMLAPNARGVARTFGRVGSAMLVAGAMVAGTPLKVEARIDVPKILKLHASTAARSDVRAATDAELASTILDFDQIFNAFLAAAEAAPVLYKGDTDLLIAIEDAWELYNRTALDENRSLLALKTDFFKGEKADEGFSLFYQSIVARSDVRGGLTEKYLEFLSGWRNSVDIAWNNIPSDASFYFGVIPAIGIVGMLAVYVGIGVVNPPGFPALSVGVRVWGAAIEVALLGILAHPMFRIFWLIPYFLISTPILSVLEFLARPLSARARERALKERYEDYASQGPTSRSETRDFKYRVVTELNEMHASRLFRGFTRNQLTDLGFWKRRMGSQQAGKAVALVNAALDAVKGNPSSYPDVKFGDIELSKLLPLVIGAVEAMPQSEIDQRNAPKPGFIARLFGSRSEARVLDKKDIQEKLVPSLNAVQSKIVFAVSTGQDGSSGLALNYKDSANPVHVSSLLGAAFSENAAWLYVVHLMQGKPTITRIPVEASQFPVNVPNGGWNWASAENNLTIDQLAIEAPTVHAAFVRDGVTSKVTPGFVAWVKRLEESPFARDTFVLGALTSWLVIPGMLALYGIAFLGGVYISSTAWLSILIVSGLVVAANIIAFPLKFGLDLLGRNEPKTSSDLTLDSPFAPRYYGTNRRWNLMERLVRNPVKTTADLWNAFQANRLIQSLTRGNVTPLKAPGMSVDEPEIQMPVKPLALPVDMLRQVGSAVSYVDESVGPYRIAVRYTPSSSPQKGSVTFSKENFEDGYALMDWNGTMDEVESRRRLADAYIALKPALQKALDTKTTIGVHSFDDVLKRSLVRSDLRVDVARVESFVSGILSQSTSMTPAQFEEYDALVMTPLVAIHQSAANMKESLDEATRNAFTNFRDGKPVNMEGVNPVTFALFKAAHQIRMKEGNAFVERLKAAGQSQHLLDMAEATHTAYFTENDMPNIKVQRTEQGAISKIFLGGYLGIPKEEETKYIRNAGYLGRWQNPNTKFKLTLDDLVENDALRVEFMNRVMKANGLEGEFTLADLQVLQAELASIKDTNAAIAVENALLKARGEKEKKLKAFPVIINTMAQSWSRLREESKLYDNVGARELYLFGLQKNAVIDTFLTQSTESAMNVPDGTPMWKDPRYQRVNIYWRMYDWHGFDDKLINSTYLPSATDTAAIAGESGIGVSEIKKDKDIFDKIYSRMDLFRIEDANADPAFAEKRTALKAIMDNEGASVADRRAAVVDYLNTYGLIVNGELNLEKFAKNHLAPLIAAKGKYGNWTDRYFRATYDVVRYAQLLRELDLSAEEKDRLAPITHDDGYFQPQKNGELVADSPLGMIRAVSNPFLGGTLRNIQTGVELSEEQQKALLTPDGVTKYQSRYKEVGSKKIKLNELVAADQDHRTAFFTAVGKTLPAEKLADAKYNPMILNTLGDLWRNLLSYTAQTSDPAAQKNFLFSKQTAAIAQVKLGLDMDIRRLIDLLGWRVKMDEIEQKLGVTKEELMLTFVMHAFWVTNPSAQWGKKDGWNNEYDKRMEQLVRATMDVMAGIEKGDYPSVEKALEDFKGELGKDLSITEAIRKALPARSDMRIKVPVSEAGVFYVTLARPVVRPEVVENISLSSVYVLSLSHEWDAGKRDGVIASVRYPRGAEKNLMGYGWDDATKRTVLVFKDGTDVSQFPTELKGSPAVSAILNLTETEAQAREAELKVFNIQREIEKQSPTEGVVPQRSADTADEVPAAVLQDRAVQAFLDAADASMTRRNAETYNGFDSTAAIAGTIAAHAARGESWFYNGRTNMAEEMDPTRSETRLTELPQGVTIHDRVVDFGNNRTLAAVDFWAAMSVLRTEIQASVPTGVATDDNLMIDGMFLNVSPESPAGWIMAIAAPIMNAENKPLSEVSPGSWYMVKVVGLSLNAWLDAFERKVSDDLGVKSVTPSIDELESMKSLVQDRLPVMRSVSAEWPFFQAAKFFMGVTVVAYILSVSAMFNGSFQRFLINRVSLTLVDLLRITGMSVAAVVGLAAMGSLVSAMVWAAGKIPAAVSLYRGYFPRYNVKRVSSVSPVKSDVMPVAPVSDAVTNLKPAATAREIPATPASIELGGKIKAELGRLSDLKTPVLLENSILTAEALAHRGSTGVLTEAQIYDRIAEVLELTAAAQEADPVKYKNDIELWGAEMDNLFRQLPALPVGQNRSEIRKIPTAAEVNDLMDRLQDVESEMAALQRQIDPATNLLSLEAVERIRVLEEEQAGLREALYGEKLSDEALTPVADENLQHLVDGLPAYIAELEGELGILKEKLTRLTLESIKSKESLKDVNKRLQAPKASLSDTDREALFEEKANLEDEISKTRDTLRHLGGQIRTIMGSLEKLSVNLTELKAQLQIQRSETREVASAVQARQAFEKQVADNLPADVKLWLQQNKSKFSTQSLDQVLGGIVLSVDIANPMAVDAAVAVLVAYVSQLRSGKFDFAMYYAAVRSIVENNQKNSIFKTSTVEGRVVRDVPVMPESGWFANLALRLATNTGQRERLVIDEVGIGNAREQLNSLLESVQATVGANNQKIGDRVTWSFERNVARGVEQSAMQMTDVSNNLFPVIYTESASLRDLLVKQADRHFATVVFGEQAASDALLAGMREIAAMKLSQKLKKVITNADELQKSLEGELLKELPGVFTYAKGYLNIENTALAGLARVWSELISRAAVAKSA